MKHKGSSRYPFSALLAISFLLVIVFLVLLNLTPPVSRDALVQHLAIPKLYLLHGGMYEIPDLLFSYYPMNLDLLYLLPLAMGNDIAPKFIHLFFGIALTLLIFVFLRNRIGTGWAFSGSLFFLTTPVIIKLSTTAYVDLGMAFFTTASVLIMLRWQKTGKGSYLILAGILAGAAAGTKYNGLITIFLLTCFVPFLSPIPSYLRSRALRFTIQYMVLFMLCALLAMSPWLIRNFHWTGNPVHPLFASILGSGTTTVTQGMNPLFERMLAYNESLLQIVLIPVRVFFQGQDDNPQYFDGVLNPFIIILTLLCFLPEARRSLQKPELGTLLWFCLLFLVFTFVQRVIRIRYIVPILPLLIILATIGLRGLQHHLSIFATKRTASIIAGLVLCGALTYNGAYMVHYWQKIRPLEYISGTVTRDAYIARFWPEYPLIKYANENLGESAHILAVFLGNRGYYFDRQVSFDLKSGMSTICSAAIELDSGGQIAAKLKGQGVSHIFLRHDLFQRFCLSQLSPDDVTKLDDFFQHDTFYIASINNHSLHELK